MQRVWTAHRPFPWLGSDKNSLSVLLYCWDITHFSGFGGKIMLKYKKTFCWVSIQSVWEVQIFRNVNVFNNKVPLKMYRNYFFLAKA